MAERRGFEPPPRVVSPRVAFEATAMVRAWLPLHRFQGDRRQPLDYLSTEGKRKARRGGFEPPPPVVSRRGDLQSPVVVHLTTAAKRRPEQDSNLRPRWLAQERFSKPPQLPLCHRGMLEVPSGFEPEMCPLYQTLNLAPSTAWIRHHCGAAAQI